MRTIIRRTKKERNRIGFQDFLDGKNEYSYFQKILQGVLKKQKGLKTSTGMRASNRIIFRSYVDTNLYEKLNNRNPLMKSISLSTKNSQITNDKSQTILKSLISHASTHPIFAMTSSDDNRCKRL